MSEFNLEEVKVIFDVRLSESNEFYPMKEVGLKLIKEVVRLRGDKNERINKWVKWAEIVGKLEEENAKLKEINKTLRVD